MAENFVVKGGPEEFLRGALEKIVFFECRLSQLTAELAAERATVHREKEVTAAVRAHEVELEMLLAQARSSITTMKSNIIELEERVRLLEAEREQFLDGFVERAQVASTPGGIDSESPGEQTDLAALAGFIAEMREKIEQLKLWKVAALKAGINIDEGSVLQPSSSVSTISTLADRFEKAGRLSVAITESEQGKELFTTRAECSLYDRSTEELTSSDPDRRKRAAECLRALGSRTAAPRVITALNRENDPAVKVALLSTLATIGESSAVTQVIREIADPHPEVRVAALDATATLAKEHAESVLVGALNDSSSLVRRRAVLLLSFMTTTIVTNTLTSMVSDPDPGVARIAAQALSGRPDIQAQSALTNALNHQEAVVRRCAADAVTRWSGEVVDPNESPVQRRRTVRRITDKLTRLGEDVLRKAMIQAPKSAAPTLRSSMVPQQPETSVIVPASKPEKTIIVETVTVEQQPEQVVRVPVSGEKPSALETSLLGEIRISLRGRSAEELSKLTGSELKAVSESLTILVKREMISQRGSRFFM
ncbi:MAG TPA: HEAT repeat domain-containing protein, partial [Chitinispirillaceae bacterium]|nr:HEAT repeat domain-containing protein [Chitinispirillaceae bacterium]